MKPLTLAVFVTIIAALIIGMCGCTSSSNTPTVTLTPTPTPKTTITLTITTSSAHPAANQSFTLSGTLKAGSTPLSGKKIILARTDQSDAYSEPYSTTTNANGAYTFTLSESESGNYRYTTHFTGDATYTRTIASLTLPVGDLQTSALSIVSSNNAPDVSQSFTLHGFLRDGVTGAPIAGQPVSLTIQTPLGTEVRVSTTTDTNGAYTFTLSESARGSYYYQFYFRGSSSYYPSEIPLELNIGNPIPTTLSLIVSNSNPGVNQAFSISGYLKDENGTALSGKALRVEIVLPTGSVATVSDNTVTDSNGHYSVTTSEQAAGQYRLELHFMGDTTYAMSGTWALVAVGTLQPTKISLNSDVTSPKLGASHTLSGTLTDSNGKPLSGKEIDLYQYAAGQINPPDIFQKRYTDSNGHYSFVITESTSGKYTYTARFVGDQTYAYSQAAVSLTVGALTPSTLT